MLAVDKQQRASVAASIESVLVGARQTSNPCICTHGLGFAGPKAESEADENIESSRIDRKQKTLDVPSKAQGHNQSYNLGTSKLTLPKFWSEGEKKDENEAAACGSDVSAAEEEPCKMAHEPRPIEETYGVIPERSFPEQECSVTAPEPGVLLEDVYPGEEAPLEEDVPFPEESVSMDIPLEVENNVPGTMQGASQAELVTKGFNNVEEQNLKQDENIPKALDDPPQPIPEPDTAPMDCTSGNDAESPVSPPLAATTQEAGLHPPSPPASSVTIPPVLEAAASEAQTIVDNHNIMLKIRASKKIHRCVVSIRAYTRTAVLDEARAYCMQNAPQNRHFRTLQKEEGDLALESLKMDKISTDISAYEGEDLSSLIRAVGTPGIPAFTLRVKSLKA
ncbi:MAG: hypothetical protein Q9202_000519 [Teloschistes flavicans]